MSARTFILAIAALLVAAIAIIAVASGGEEDDSVDVTATDGAFITMMIPHHESAIEMARLATRKGEHPEVKALAGRITSTQATEIDDLERIHQRLFDQPADQGSHGTLGMPAHEMGMHMDAAELAGEEPFDRAFIDMMVPHHQGAIRMARIELAEGDDPELMRLAEAIIAAQAREIEEMNRWRTDWYGKPSPAGRVPAEGHAMPSHEEMGH